MLFGPFCAVGIQLCFLFHSLNWKWCCCTSEIRPSLLLISGLVLISPRPRGWPWPSCGCYPRQWEKPLPLTALLWSSGAHLVFVVIQLSYRSCRLITRGLCQRHLSDSTQDQPPRVPTCLQEACLSVTNYADPGLSGWRGCCPPCPLGSLCLPFLFS